MQKYLRFNSLEFCTDSIKDFYTKFFLGRRGYYEDANIQIASGSTGNILIIKRINSHGTAMDFEDYEVAHCTSFSIRNEEIVILRYSECIGGKFIKWDNRDEMATEMINYIKEHGLLQL